MKENHILPFLWMRGEEEAVLRKEMEKIKEAGISSVCLEARPHPDYAGDGWWHDVDVIIAEAKKRDMTIWILDDAHFPTGMANHGMDRHPEEARRFLFTNFVDVTGPMPSAQVDVDLLLTKQFTWVDIGKPESSPLYEETKLLSVTALRMKEGDMVTGEPIDLTDHVKDGYLTADIGEGTWRIFVSFSTTAIGPKPEYINYIEASSVKVLLEEVYEKHYARYKDLFGSVIKGFFSDEPGFYNKDTYDENSFVGFRMPLPWGAEMDALLKERYKGNLYRDIPYLFAEEENKAHRLLRVAYMDAVSGLYKKNFSCQVGNWCREHGVEYIGHIVEDNCGYMRLGAGIGHYFRAMAGQDMAGIDNIGYQLMPCNDVAIRHTGFSDCNPEFFHYQLGKLGSSDAAIDPAKKGRLMCENFGAYGWRLGVRDMKWLVDYLVCQGVNYFVPHAFSMAEYPDSDCPPHFYARGNNPQFPFFCDLMGYTDRLCSLFSDGQNVPHAAVLFEAEADWAGHTMLGSAVGKELITNQIDFEIIPSDVFTNAEYYGCKVEDGSLIVNERKMGALIVPECEYLPSAAAKFICEHSTLPVIYVNHMPIGIADMEDEGGMLPGAAANGRECVELKELAGKLRSMGIHDQLFSDTTDANLRQYHYRKDGRDFWMFMNASSYANVDLLMQLPDSGAYGCYDAMYGRMEEPEMVDGKFHLELKPYQSIILCTDPEDCGQRTVLGNSDGSLELEDFTLELKEIGKSESETMEHFKLAPISSIKRDFSGTMVYRTKADIQTMPKHAVLKAEHVYECMSVTVNGTKVANVIAPPYELDIAPALKEGENEIEISVASTALRNANTKPGMFGKERTVIEPTGMFGRVSVELYGD